MWQVRGHDALLKHIESSLRQGQHAHAYLLVGPAHVGKLTLAMNMAQAMNCLSPEPAPCGICSQCQHIASARHADVQIIGVDGGAEEGPPRKEIGIGVVREVQHQASLKPYEGTHRVFIFDGAEHMSEEAANALLKTLEEPPPQVLIILLTSREEALLPTVRSRCRRLELRPMPIAKVMEELATTHSMEEEDAKNLAHLSMGRIGWALSALTDPSIMERRKDELQRLDRLATASLEDRFKFAADLASLFSRNREAAREALHMWLCWWRDLLLIQEESQEFVYNLDWLNTLRLRATEFSKAQVVAFIQAILSTLVALEDNVNPRLALEALMLQLPGASTEK